MVSLNRFRVMHWTLHPMSMIRLGTRRNRATRIFTSVTLAITLTLRLHMRLVTDIPMQATPTVNTQSQPSIHIEPSKPNSPIQRMQAMIHVSDNKTPSELCVEGVHRCD